jgi:hypothetical protein
MFWEKCNLNYLKLCSLEFEKISGIEVLNKNQFGFTFLKKRL